MRARSNGLQIEMVDKKTRENGDDGFGARRTYVGQSVNSPTGTTVAYSNEIVPNSSVDFTTAKNLIGLESGNEWVEERERVRHEYFS